MSAPDEFDPAERAANIKAVEFRRNNIAESTARLMAFAANNGWGDVEGVPTLSGDCLVYHFTSGRRGIVRLPMGTDYGNKET